MNKYYFAACMNSLTSVFFPNPTSKLTSKEVVRAKQICDKCLIKDLCLQNAIENDEPDGIWGGLTYRERKNLESSHD